MASRTRKPRLSHNAIVAAKPKRSEYMLWDGTLSHFGLRVHPSGVRSFIVQTRVHGRMRKVTLGRFPEMSLARARQEAASALALLWAGGDIAPKARAPLFRDFAARYRERRKYRWKPSSLETHDIYMRNRLMPAFGRLRLDAIDHARVSAWFDAASASKPGAANRAFEILRAMLGTARQWGELGVDAPDACANIVMNRRKPVARYLGREELERLGAVLDRHGGEHPWPVAVLRLLTLTGARLAEVLNLRWEEIGELSGNGTSARLEDSKTGPRTLWLGPEATKVIASLPRREDRGARGGRTVRPSHPRLPAHLGVPGGHERRGAHHRGAAARTQEAVHHRDLRPSGRQRPAGRRRAGGARDRRGHGIQGRAAA